jgi:hypothetical protein
MIPSERKPRNIIWGWKRDVDVAREYNSGLGCRAVYHKYMRGVEYDSW